MTTELIIKNMVCDRCIMIVKQCLQDASIGYDRVRLGEVKLLEAVSDNDLETLRKNLKALGFELLDDPKAAVVNRIKSAIIQHIHTENPELMNLKLSVFLSENLKMDYAYLSALFSATEGLTIEKFVILQRIERVKEFLTYNELTLSEIAWNMSYSSVQHLSQQFKNITGLTPSQFKNAADADRRALDQIQG